MLDARDVAVRDLIADDARNLCGIPGDPDGDPNGVGSTRVRALDPVAIASHGPVLDVQLNARRPPFVPLGCRAVPDDVALYADARAPSTERAGPFLPFRSNAQPATSALLVRKWDSIPSKKLAASVALSVAPGSHA